MTQTAQSQRDAMLLTGKVESLGKFLAEMSLPDIHSPFGERCGNLSNPPAPLAYEYCRGRLGKYLSWKIERLKQPISKAAPVYHGLHHGLL